MGQKTNPIGLRLNIRKNWDSIWFDEKNYADKLHEDIIVRKYLENRLVGASVYLKLKLAVHLEKL